MPLIPYWIYLGAGALIGGGGVWVVSETSKTLTTFALIGGGLYLYANRKG